MIKKNNIFLYFALISGLTLITNIIYGQEEKKFIRQGNRLYNDDKYPEAEISYRKGIDADKSSGKAQFNLGDALYRQNKYEDAAKQFQANAEITGSRDQKADNYYNLGNSLLQASKIKESIEAYKNSLRLNPDSKEAKYNLAYAQDLLKQQEQQQQQQQQQNSDRQEQDKDNKKENQDKSNDQNKQQQDQQKQQQQQQQQDGQQISKEDAQRLLDALANDEKKVQEKVKEAKAAKARVRTLINW